MQAFNVRTANWRTIDTTIEPAIMTWDENGDLIAYQSSDKRVYSAAASEAVGCLLRTKTFAIDDDEKKVVRYISVTYKSVTALTMKVYIENAIESGEIAYNNTYEVVEEPYINGSTYTVTYLGTGYTHGQTFTGVPGNKTFSESGTGIVVMYDSYTLPATTIVKDVRRRVSVRALKFFIEILDAATSVTATEIHRLRPQFE